MDERLVNYCKVKIRTHVESIQRIREIQSDLETGKMSRQEAKLCIEEEEQIIQQQLKTFRDFYELSEEEVEVADG